MLFQSFDQILDENNITTKNPPPRSRLKFFILLALPVIAATLFWFPRNETPITHPVISNDKRFTGGQYPDKTMLAKLKAQGYTTVVSLLDPLNFPMELFFIYQEEKNISALGLNLIRIPLSASDANNLQDNKRIQALAKSIANAKYYVHGFRDQQRIDIFMNTINRYSAGEFDANAVTPFDYKTIHCERGNAIQLDNHVIVAPRPTDAEISQYFVSTPNQTVELPIQSFVSINPDENNIKGNSISKLLQDHHIQYFSLPISLYPYNADAILKVVKKIKSMHGGVLIYSYYMPPQSIIISAFITSYLTNLPSLPKGLFTLPMQNGAVNIIAPNVAVGPQPAEEEFDTYLAEHGIKNIGYAGNCSKPQALQDKTHAQAANLQWTCLQNKDNIIITPLKKGGPWYVYGESLSDIQPELIRRLGKTMPDPVLTG